MMWMHPIVIAMLVVAVGMVAAALWILFGAVLALLVGAGLLVAVAAMVHVNHVPNTASNR